MPMIESVRSRLRGLVQLIDKRQRRPVYTDFEDSMGGETDFTLPGLRRRHRSGQVHRQGAGVLAPAPQSRRRRQAEDEPPAHVVGSRRARAPARRERGRRAGRYPPGGGECSGPRASRPFARRDGQGGGQGGADPMGSSGRRSWTSSSGRYRTFTRRRWRHEPAQRCLTTAWS